jgi:UDP-N-acetyl-D-glucosamine dehydrogenase
VEELVEKIKKREIRIGVMGLGRVGLSVALAFAKQFKVIGYELNKNTVNGILRGESHVPGLSNQELQNRLNRSFWPTFAKSDVAECDFILICVPTLLTSENEPELSQIKDCTKTIAGFLRQGQFVVQESTTYPGTTEEVVLPILEQSGLKSGIDFGLAYSPERIDSGSKYCRVESIPKVVGGITPKCTDIAATLYETIVPAVVKVKDCKTAEACKILENVFRSVNIALINEIAISFEKMGINTWEVIEAATTKPFGFMPFYPGPGVGGHCISVASRYLSYSARRYDVIPLLTQVSSELNDFMKMHVVNLVEKGLQTNGKSIRGSRIVVIGLSYKKSISDPAESPATRIIEVLVNLGGDVLAYDPYVRQIETAVGLFKSEARLETALEGADCAIFLVEHDSFKTMDAKHFKCVMSHPIVVDCMNVFRSEDMDSIVYFAVGKPTSAMRQRTPLDSLAE